MHLGFKNGFFVPHNLIPVPESPVLLIRFQKAPRLKFLISTGSQKKKGGGGGAQIYMSE